MTDAPRTSHRPTARRVGPLATLAVLGGFWLLSGPLNVVFRLLPLDSVPHPVWIAVLALAVAGKWMAHRRGRPGLADAICLIALLALIVPVIALFGEIQGQPVLQLLAGAGALAALAALLYLPRPAKTPDAR